MFDQVKFGVSDCAASKAFCLAALAPLGITAVAEREPGHGIKLCHDGQVPMRQLMRTTP